MSRPTPSLPQSVIALRAVTQARSTRLPSAVQSTRPQPDSPARPETPRDCVREYPSSASDSVDLKVFDWSGRVRHEMTVPIADNVQGWADLMLKQCRKCFPRPYQLKLVD